MPTETQVDFRIWDHRSPEGDAIGVGFKEMGGMNGGLQRIPWTEPLCGGTLGSSEFFPRADPLQGRQTYWARPWDGRALLGPRRPVMGHLRLHVYSYAVMVSVILANPCMGPRGTYRNVSVKRAVCHFRSFLWRHPSRPLDKGFILTEAHGPQHCLDVAFLSHSLLGSSLSCLGTSCPLSLAALPRSGAGKLSGGGESQEER